MFKIKTEKDLTRFLKVIAEEAVKETKTILSEKGIQNDPYVNSFQKRLENDGLLEEEDSDEDPEELSKDEKGPEASSKDDKESEDDENNTNTNPAREKALSLGGYDEDLGASFESVVTAINTMRAGRSLRDKEIKTELNDYYDRLDENEREILLLFLKELSKILTGALDGDEAQDPGDASTYFNITRRDKESDQSGSEKNKMADQDVKSKPAQQYASTSSGSSEEDTSPPIKVNETQDLTLLRQKVRLLMRS